MTPKILIVDDDKLITTIYADFFSSRGFMVETSNTPFGVTTAVRTFSPDVIIVDVNLPGMNGKNLCGLLAEKGSRGVVLISGERQEPEMKEMISAGLAQDYFIKGQSLVILNSKVNRLI